MMRRLGIFYGLSFITGGTLGFVPAVTSNGLFLGTFAVNPLHSAMHLASGVIFLIATMIGAWATRLWFQLFGLAYVLLAGWGFWAGDGMICGGLITNNAADAWGHAGLALSMLVIGFASARPVAVAA